MGNKQKKKQIKQKYKLKKLKKALKPEDKLIQYKKFRAN